MSLFAATCAVLAAASWTPVAHLTGTRTRVQSRSSLLTAKKAPDETGEPVYQASVSIGSICEFHDPKHGNGKADAVLGVVESTQMKAKGSETVTLVDATGKHHTIKSNAIHIVLPPTKSKEVEPAEILAPYCAIAENEPMALGLDPNELEIAWELLAEEEITAVSPKQIISMTDLAYQSALDRYRAFRLLTSDLGKVFFKSISDNTFKPKSSASVKASKDAWCHTPEHAAMQEFCFV